MGTIVESQRQLGGSAYPVQLERFIELVGQEPGLVRKAVRLAEKQGVLITSLKLPSKAGPTDRSMLIAISRDAATVATSPALLKTVLGSKRTDDASAFDAATLSKCVGAPLAKPFEAYLEGLTQRTMPESVGAILVRKKRLFFLLEDAWLSRSSGSSPSVSSTSIGADFAERFGRAFDALNRAQGEQNYVLVGDLRRELAGVSRADFDRGLNALRRAKTFTLDSTDGRHVRLTREQLDGGLEEAGRLLVYVARRAP